MKRLVCPQEVESLGPYPLKALEPGVARRWSYYWGPQWSVRPDLHRNIGNVITPAGSHASIRSDARPPERAPAALPKAALEMSTGSGRDLVEEWQARQQVCARLPDMTPPVPRTEEPEPPNKTDERDPLERPPAIAKLLPEIREHFSRTSPQSAGPKRRLVALPLPILGLSVGGAWVVGLGLYFLVHLGDINVPFPAKEERQHTPVEGSHRTGDSPGQSRLSQQSAPAELSAPRFPVIGQVKEPAAAVPSTEIAAGGPTLAISLPGLSPKSPSAGESTAPIATHSGSSPSSSDRDLTESNTDLMLQSTPHRGGDNTTLAGQEESEPKTRQSRPQMASTPTTERVSAPTPAPDARQREEASAATTVPHSQGLDEPRTFAIDASAFLARGDTLLGYRDVASARLFYERAADAGNAQAAIRMGGTFDPSFLAKVRLNEVLGDPAVARRWYKRAQELGASEAGILLIGLERR